MTQILKQIGRITIPIVFGLTLTGCGGMLTVSEEKKTPVQYSPAVQAMEENKQALTHIKEKTADDIELGYKTRLLERRYQDDTEFGQKVRALVDVQEKRNTDKGACNKVHLTGGMISMFLAMFGGLLFCGIRLYKKSKPSGVKKDESKK